MADKKKPKVRSKTRGRPKMGYGPLFACRLFEAQHRIVMRICEQTGATKAEVVRRLLAESLDEIAKADP